MNLMNFVNIRGSFYGFVYITCTYCNRSAVSYKKHESYVFKLYGCKKCKRGAVLLVGEESSFGIVEDANDKMMVYEWDFALQTWTWFEEQHKIVRTS